MQGPLAGAAGEAFTTTKSISTLIVARLPLRFVGLFFLLSVAATTSQISISNSRIDSAISHLPHIYSSVSPITTKISAVRDSLTKDSLSFKADVKSESKDFYNPTLSNSISYNVPQELKTVGGTLRYERKMRVFATSYDKFCPGCTETTATGLKAGRGVIAVDPSVIALGSKIYVPGYGVAVAGDTGSAIKGAVVDLGFDNVKNGSWGARFTDLYILTD